MRRFLALATLLGLGLVGLAQPLTLAAQQAASSKAPVVAQFHPFPSCNGMPGPC